MTGSTHSGEPGISLAVTIDTECDKGPGWRVRQPLGFRNVLEGVPGRLQPIFERWGVKPTYLLSPEVLLHDGCVGLFRSLNDRVELGTHLHSEFVGPGMDLRATETISFQSDFPPEVEFEKLSSLTETFKDRMGYAPASFRAGRFGISTSTLGMLEELGYAVDSSVTPHMWWWRAKGKGVNFLGAPDQPYYPDPRDPRKPGDSRVLEVPLTLVNRFWDKWPPGLLRRIDPISRIQTVALNVLVRKRLRCSWLRPTFATAAEMLALTEYMRGRVGADRLVLCMMFHSNEATAGMSPYHATAEEVDGFLARLSGYLEAVFSRFEVKPVGLSDLAADR